MVLNPVILNWEKLTVFSLRQEQGENGHYSTAFQPDVTNIVRLKKLIRGTRISRVKLSLFADDILVNLENHTESMTILTQTIKGKITV